MSATEGKTKACSDHNEQKVQYICCERLICALCLPKHEHHETLMDFDQKIEQFREGLPDLMNTLDGMKSKFQRKLKQNETFLDRNETAWYENKRNIHDRIQEILKYFEKLEQSLISECEKMHEVTEDILNKAVRKQKSALSKLEDVQSKCTEITSNKSKHKTMRAILQVDRKVREVSEDTGCSDQIPDIPEFVSAQKEASSKMLRNMVGSINYGLDMDSDWITEDDDDIVIDRKFKWKKKNVGIAPINVESAWLYKLEEGEPIYLVSQSGDIMPITNPNPKHRKISKVATTPQGACWVTDIENKSVKIIRENGTLEHKFHVDPFHPFGISAGKLGNYVWICLADKASFIPSVTGRTLVVKMTYDGDAICKIENEGVTFSFPYRCAENTNGDVCVVDRLADSKGHVLIFDKDLKLKSGYIGTTVDKEFDPRDVCCNNQGNIIISDFSNNAIHILEHDGSLQRLLRTDVNNLMEPLTVATDNSDRIWISFYSGHVIIISYP